ncbi:MAG: hypothetical protein KDA63_03590 [Planctomycetales bacterium]|nr:hypothetical protein [Planctomycetales bacterium]
MIGKLLGGATHLVMYLATATVLSQGIIVGSLWSTGRLNPTNLMQIRALLQGSDVTDLVPDDDAPEQNAGPAEPSLVEIEQARAVTMFNLQKRGEEINSLYVDVRREQHEVAQRTKSLTTRSDHFNELLLSTREQASARGVVDVRTTLENLEPSQAKDQIMLMIKDGRENEVVGMLRKMAVDIRAGILAEFVGQETEVADILERMARGTPEADLVDETLGPRVVMMLGELENDGPQATKIRRFLDELFPQTAAVGTGSTP